MLFRGRSRARTQAFAAAAIAALLGAAALPAHGEQPEAGEKKPAAKRSKPPPPPPLDGTSYDFEYDGLDVGHPERAWLGRAFVHRRAAALPPEQGLPVLVFLHGNNVEKIKYRWMGGGSEGDVRRIVSELIEAGQVPPMLVAAPSSTNPVTMANAVLTWPAFDLDHFLDKTAARLAGVASIDRSRVIVAGHSGGGCNIRGGLATASRAKTPVLAAFSIDTCMLLDLAKHLATAGSTHVVVSWQTMSWDNRPFNDFRTVFQRETKKSQPPPGTLRELDYEAPTVPMAHDAMVPITLKKWLPRVLAPATASPAPPPPARAPANP